MLCVPKARVEILNVATPLPLRVGLLKVTDPSLIVTVPLGVPAPGNAAVNVAVKVTFWPMTDGLMSDVSAITAASLLTACVKADELAEKFVSAL